MRKTVLITGATDGIGLLSAKKLIADGHHVLLHGRSIKKIQHVKSELQALNNEARIDTFRADLSDFDQTKHMTQSILAGQDKLDAIINNAGIYQSEAPVTPYNIDMRFVVNTLSPYLISTALLPMLGQDGRIINVSSAAQATVDISALRGQTNIKDTFNAYAQSKLAIIMWSRQLARITEKGGPDVITVNPGSLLATKMVQQGFGVAGKDVNQGADILLKAALSDDFAHASGQYFDNDSGHFTSPHQDAMDVKKCRAVVEAIEQLPGFAPLAQVWP